MTKNTWVIECVELPENRLFGTSIDLEEAKQYCVYCGNKLGHDTLSYRWKRNVKQNSWSCSSGNREFGPIVWRLSQVPMIQETKEWKQPLIESSF